VPEDEELAEVIAEWTLEEQEAARARGVEEALEAAKSAALSQHEPVKDENDDKTEIVRKTRRRK
jgi:hypothetical protein